jgi:hypothetical protein
MKKVRIISYPKLPKAAEGMEVKGSSNAKTLNWPALLAQNSKKPISTRNTLTEDRKAKPNLEAELGEYVVANLDGSGLPSGHKIGGKKHYNNGTKLNLPEDSFIFSAAREMALKGSEILNEFGITNKKQLKKGVVPADIAKKLPDMNKYRAVLADPDSDKMQRKTAEMMLANISLKMAKLGLAQESLKGFPQGIPKISQPYVDMMNMNPEEFFTQTEAEPEEEGEEVEDTAKYGKQVGLPKAQFGRAVRRGGVAYRYNPSTNMIEIINAQGRIIGYGRPGTNTQGTTQTTSGGTRTVKTKKIVKKQNIPADAIIIDQTNPEYKTKNDYIKARDKAFAESGDKPVYTKDKDGKYYQVNKGKYLNAKNDQELLDQQIKLIKDRFSNPKVAAALKQKMLEAYDKDKEFGKDQGYLGKQPGFTRADIENMTEEELAKKFIELNERNLKTAKLFNVNKEELKKVYECFDTESGKLLSNSKCKDVPYKTLDEAFAKAGLPLPQEKAARNKEVGIQQLSYIGFTELLKDRDAGTIKDEETKELIKPFIQDQLGASDEKFGGKEKQNFSKADGVYTNTTAGEIAGIAGDDIIGEGLVAEEDTEIEEDVTVKDPQYVSQSGEAPIFKQDLIKIAGALGDAARLKKYMAWQATPGTFTGEPTFYSPERELAKIGEQSAMAMNSLATFAGPQALSSRLSGVTGQAGAAAADVLGKYNNLNVGVQNQFEMQKAQILNQAAQQKAALKTALFDKNTIANQQFDNSKALARQNIRQGYIDAITNAVNAANLNLVYDQYKTDPRKGGLVSFTNGKPVTPEYNPADMATQFNTLKSKLPGVDDATIYKLLTGDRGTTASNNSQYLKDLNTTMNFNAGPYAQQEEV